METFEEDLEKARQAYEKATKDFLDCRCYSYYQLVLVTAKQLLDASDAHLEWRRSME